jgi:hypothetical protein
MDELRTRAVAASRAIRTDTDRFEHLLSRVAVHLHDMTTASRESIDFDMDSEAADRAAAEALAKVQVGQPRQARPGTNGLEFD